MTTKQKTKKQSETTENINQIVIFELDGVEYAVSIDSVREIIQSPTITSIPNAPEYIKGIVNLRGQIVVILDLKKKLSLLSAKETESPHILIATHGDDIFGLFVDKVSEVLRLTNHEIKDPPEMVSNDPEHKYLKGVILLGDKEKKKKDAEESRMISFLDLKNIITDHQNLPNNLEESFTS